jgi:hypothetical protein
MDSKIDNQIDSLQSRRYSCTSITCTHAVDVVITPTERATQSCSDDGGGYHGAQVQHSLVDENNQVRGLAASIAWSHVRLTVAAAQVMSCYNRLTYCTAPYLQCV